MLLLHRKDQIEYEAERVLVQAHVNAEAAVKAFEEYSKFRYPYLETSKKKEKDATIAQLLAEVKKGPLVVTAARGSSSVKSRMRKGASPAQKG